MIDFVSWFSAVFIVLSSSSIGFWWGVDWYLHRLAKNNVHAWRILARAMDDEYARQISSADSNK